MQDLSLDFGQHSAARETVRPQQQSAFFVCECRYRPRGAVGHAHRGIRLREPLKNHFQLIGGPMEGDGSVEITDFHKLALTIV